MRVVKQVLKKVLKSINRCGGSDSQRGQMLIWSILITTFGALVIVSLLVYSSASLRVTDSTLDNAEEYYAADAGIMAVVADLVQGTDALDTGYTTPSVTLNNKSVTISVSPPSPGSAPDCPYQYFDPRASGGLDSLGTDAHYTFQLDNVVAQSDFIVHWSFTPTVESWAITLYEGAGTEGTVVSSSALTLSPGYLNVDGSLITGGTYTIDFHNPSDSTLSSGPFNDEGGSGYTWIYTRARKDYLVEAVAEGTTIVAYVRQTPGPAVSPNAMPSVTIMSWQTPAST